MNLTDRQIIILKAIIEEYIESAQAVGSETLEKKYNLSVSPATIRNEMVALTKTGFLKQLHTSAGRVPTPMALKFYVTRLLKPDQMPVSEEVSAKEKVWDVRHEEQKLLAEAVKALAQKSGTLSVISTDSGDMYQSGVSHILDYPEFYDIDLTKTVLALLDRSDFWIAVSRRPIGHDPFYLLLGEEFGSDIYSPCSFLYTRFQARGVSGVIGVMGPYRLPYGRLIPMVTYFGELISTVGR
jgi:heat-inducible transcriptional repressor